MSLVVQLDRWRCLVSWILLIPILSLYYFTGDKSFITISHYWKSLLYHVQFALCSFSHVVCGWHFHKAIKFGGPNLYVSLVSNYAYLMSVFMRFASWLYVDYYPERYYYHVAASIIAFQNFIWVFGSVFQYSNRDTMFDLIKKCQSKARSVRSNDQVKIDPGVYFPADGVIDQGETTVDESNWGLDDNEVKKPKDGVMAGTLNKSDYVIFTAKQSGKKGCDVVYKKMMNKVFRDGKGFLVEFDKLGNYLLFLFVSFVMFFVTIVMFLCYWNVITHDFFGLEESEYFGFNVPEYLSTAFLSLICLFYPLSWGKLVFDLALGNLAARSCLMTSKKALSSMKNIRSAIINMDCLLEPEMRVTECVVFPNNFKLTKRKLLKKIVACEKKLKHHSVTRSVITYVKENDILDPETVKESETAMVGNTGFNDIISVGDKNYSFVFGNIDYVSCRPVKIGRKMKEVIEKSGVSFNEVVIMAVDAKIVGYIIMGHKFRKGVFTLMQKLHDRNLTVTFVSKFRSFNELSYLTKMFPGKYHCGGEVDAEERKKKLICQKRIAPKVVYITDGKDISDENDSIEEADLSVILDQGKDTIVTENSDMILHEKDFSLFIYAYDIAHISEYLFSMTLRRSFIYNVLILLISMLSFYFYHGSFIPPLVGCFIQFLVSAILMVLVVLALSRETGLKHESVDEKEMNLEEKKTGLKHESVDEKEMSLEEKKEK